MTEVSKCFFSVNEEMPSAKWLNFFQTTHKSYQQWFLQEGDSKRPSLSECEQSLKEYMPELHELWKNLLELSNADDLTARLLSLYCPTPYINGCSQAVWSRYTPVLVKNYDYSQHLTEGRLLKSNWHGTSVIANTDCLWGALDGMNEHGLCVSLAYGGSEVIGEGFAIPLILRYVLEFCQTTQQALKALERIPTNMAYDITLIDSYFDTATIELSPIMPAQITGIPFAVNYQGGFELGNYALFSRSYQRKKAIIERLSDPLSTIESFIDSFEYAPLFTSDYQNNFGTLYTAVYNPQLKAMEMRWPYNVRMYQSFEYFVEQEYLIRY